MASFIERTGEGYCGAKTKAGTPCKNRALKNGRCKLHGGLSPGGAEGNTNRTTFGIYSKFYTAEDLAVATDSTIGTVDHEIILLRVRVARILKAEALAESMGTEALEPVEVISEGKNGEEIVTRKTRRLPDFDKILDMAVGRIGKMELIKAQLEESGKGGGDTPLDQARQLFEAINKIKQSDGYAS